MIDLEFVERLIRSVDESSIDTVELERGGTRIRVSKTPQGTVVQGAGPLPQPAAQGGVVPQAAGGSSNHPAPAEAVTDAGVTEEEGTEEGKEDWLEVTSPMVGTFFRAPAPDADPFTDVGKRISKGDTLCIIEAMKLMNELEAEVGGTVREVCVENGDPVEYGQLLFRVEPD